MRKISMFNILLVLVLAIMLMGCNTPQPPIIEEKHELTITYTELMYYSQEQTIEVKSIYEDDLIFYEVGNNKLITIDEQSNGIYKIKANQLGSTNIIFTSSYALKEYSISIIIEAKEGFAPPIEKIELSIKEQGPYYVGEIYHLEYKTYPEIYNDTLKYILNDDYDINTETGEIIFKHAGTFIVSMFAQKKAIRTNITVDVNFPKDKEMYEILYIGNSLTYVHDIPSIIKAMIEADGSLINYCQDTPGGSYLKDHRNNFDLLIKKYDFTHVILQGQSYEAIGNFNEFRSEIVRYNEIAKKLNQDTQVILYQSWAYNKEIYNGLKKYDMTQKLKDAYDSVAKEINAKVTRSGEAFKLFETTIGLEPSLYQDMNHQSIFVAYLSACVHYATITGKRASNNTYENPNIDSNMIKSIQSIADEISFGK